jgi:hypothetical protein
MNVVVMVVVFTTGCAAEGILGVTRIVEYFVHNTLVEKSAQRSIDGNPIIVRPETRFYVAMGQRMVGLQEQIEHLQAVAGVTQIMIF